MYGPEFMFLSMVIPGPSSPGWNIDVCLRPLIDELTQLWSSGSLTFDISRKQNFVMRAALMWTINDFFVGRVEKDVAPPFLSGEELFDVVSEYGDIVFGLQSGKQKFHGFGLTHNWVKRSIFW